MPEDFGERLRKVRESKGLNQAQLAEKSGLQPSAVSHFELGRRSPSFDNLKRLADALSVTIDYLLGRQHEANYRRASCREVLPRLRGIVARRSGSNREICQRPCEAERISSIRRPWIVSEKLDQQEAEYEAGKVLATHASGDLPICPFAIAKRVKIVFQPKPSSARGVSGFLMRSRGDLRHSVRQPHCQRRLHPLHRCPRAWTLFSAWAPRTSFPHWHGAAQIPERVYFG